MEPQQDGGRETRKRPSCDDSEPQASRKKTKVQVSTGAWIPELRLSMKDKADIQNGRPASFALCCSTAFVLRHQFRDKYFRMVYENITPLSFPAIQLHLYSPPGHVFVSVCDGKRVLVADSDLRIPSPAFKQITDSYGSLVAKPLKHTHFLNVHQQAPDDYSCLMYSTANVVEFLTPGGNPECEYDTKLLRPHFIHCLENKKFTPFPKKPQPP